MNKKKTAHIISHTHWDREWYMPYEYHHVLLIELLDKLLETLDSDPEYKYFHLDGQTIIIDDYLQIRPEQRSKLEAYIKAGRIHIGPWYVLQDEFLTSSEANIRNLLIGHQDAKPFGVISKTGYFPDSFGNMGQAAQILQQADIGNAIFGRGVKPTGFNNMVGEADTYESPYSEMIWQSPDGSSVLGILFANWYSNGNEIPVGKEQAQVYWDKKFADAEEFASTSQLLYMNGCDHQPIQTDLSEALQTASVLYPDVEFKHSNFDEYIASLEGKLPEDLVTIEGELRSQHTDGWGTLVNTASARVYLKQLNQQGQTLLEKVAEPLAAFAQLSGGHDYPHHLFTYAWKTLMQNHPHDSICGCSVDEVHREMVTRFAKSKHVTEQIVAQSLATLAAQIHTAGHEAWGDGAVPFTIFNTTGWIRTGTVSTEIEVAKKYFPEGPSPQALASELKQLSLDGFSVVDHQGNTVWADMEDLGVHFGYELPKDRFRQPYMARKVRITLHAENVPMLGYVTYALVPGTDSSIIAKASSENRSSAAQVSVDGFTMDNGIVRVTVEDNGTLSIHDLRSGREYHGLNSYENTGDIGNEYVYRQPEGEQTLTTNHLQAVNRVVKRSPYQAVIESVLTWEIPAEADELFEQEKQEIVLFTERKAQRTERTVPLVLTTQYTLEAGSGMVQVRTSFHNQAKDHRLRALFPSDLKSEQHYADSIFEIAKRDTVPATEWINPSNAQHQQAFVSVTDHAYGLTIANKGLNEYEVLQDEHNTVAITLLRAVSELGDWGVFDTPEAQCLGEQTVEYAILVHAQDGIQSGAYAQAYQFQIPWTVVQTGLHEGALPLTHQWLSWQDSANSVAFSTLKMSGETGDLIARWFNMGGGTTALHTELFFESDVAYASDVLERRREELTSAADEIGGFKIVTRAYETTSSR